MRTSCASFALRHSPARGRHRPTARPQRSERNPALKSAMGRPRDGDMLVASARRVPGNRCRASARHGRAGAAAAGRSRSTVAQHASADTGLRDGAPITAESAHSQSTYYQSTYSQSTRYQSTIGALPGHCRSATAAQRASARRRAGTAMPSPALLAAPARRERRVQPGCASVLRAPGLPRSTSRISSAAPQVMAMSATLNVAKCQRPM